MGGAFLKLILISGFVRSCYGVTLGSPVLTCDDVHLTLSSTVKCSCQNIGGNGIIWNTNGAYLTQCTKLNALCFNTPGYIFSVNASTSTYTVEFGSYPYTDCRNISCNDATTPSHSAFKQISLDETSFNPTISVANEPSTSHTNGNINFTTDCIYKARSGNTNLTAIWSAIDDKGEDKNLDVDSTIYKFGSCQSCSQDFASQYFVGFYHKEDTSEHKMEAKIRLQLKFDRFTLNSTTNQKYFVKGKNESFVSNNVTSTLNTTSTSTSAAVNDTATTMDRNGIPSCILTTSELRNSTIVTTVPEKDLKVVHNYATLLYLSLACFCIIFTAVMVCYIFCLIMNKKETNKNENYQSDQHNFTDLPQTSYL